MLAQARQLPGVRRLTFIILHDPATGVKKNLPKKPAVDTTESCSGEGRENSRADKTLGMEEGITRRDFLNATLLASGAQLLGASSPLQLLAGANRVQPVAEDEWTGFGGVGDYANSNGHMTGGMEAGHQIRDGGIH